MTSCSCQLPTCTIGDNNGHAADPINPAHYRNGPIHRACGKPIECIDITRHMDFDLGNNFKYIWRLLFGDGTKVGVEQLKKARWYLDDAIEMWENDQ